MPPREGFHKKCGIPPLKSGKNINGLKWLKTA